MPTDLSLGTARFAALGGAVPWLWLTLWLAAGCQTPRPLPQVDLEQPGWQTRKCPALWRPARGAPEIAGELFWACHVDGRTLINFAKIPFPTLTAWREPGRWQIEFQPRNRRASGRGAPPARHLLFWAPEALAGRPLPPQVVVEPGPGDATLRLCQLQTGETLTLFSGP